MSQSRGLKIATFNLWHGLAGRGILRFREFESPERREARFEESLRTLHELEPDVLLLQELNPVSLRGRELRQRLGGSFRGRVDQSGLKFFARGFPLNLATGLGILVRGSVRAADRGGDADDELPSFVRLSGSLGFSGENLSFHLDEQRYAQLSSVQHEAFGRLLIVNVHLHHGFERFPPLMRLLDQALTAGRISSAHHDELLLSLDQAQARRLSEIDRLLEVVHAAESRHDGILIGGDLNSTAEGASYRALIADGYRDLSNDQEPTWDPVLNFENHRIQREGGFDFPLPTFGNPEFSKIYRAFDELPRRIDFLLAKGSLVRSASVARFGIPKKESDLAPSDHFGVIATFHAGGTS